MTALKEFVPEYLLEHSQDLDRFLEALDEVISVFKLDIDEFVYLVDVNLIPQEFLEVWGHSAGLDRFVPKDKWGEVLREVAWIYRRRGEIDYYEAIFRLNDILGWVKELYPETIDLNSRQTLNSGRITGKIYSHGSIRIVTANVFANEEGWVKDLVEFSMPAGRVVWWRNEYRLSSGEVVSEELYDMNVRFTLYTTEKPAEGIFELNGSQLNGQEVLTWDYALSFAGEKVMERVRGLATTGFPDSITKADMIDSSTNTTEIWFSYYGYPNEPSFFGGGVLDRSSLA